MGDLDSLHFWAPDCCLNECLIAKSHLSYSIDFHGNLQILSTFVSLCMQGAGNVQDITLDQYALNAFFCSSRTSKRKGRTRT